MNSLKRWAAALRCLWLPPETTISTPRYLNSVTCLTSSKTCPGLSLRVRPYGTIEAQDHLSRLNSGPNAKSTLTVASQMRCNPSQESVMQNRSSKKENAVISSPTSCTACSQAIAVRLQHIHARGRPCGMPVMASPLGNKAEG